MGNAGKYWAKEKGERFYHRFAQKTCKKLPLQIENYFIHIDTGMVILMLFGLLWFTFCLTFLWYPFKVTVTMRKNHRRFDPISWIWQKTILNITFLDLGFKKKTLECWTIGVVVSLENIGFVLLVQFSLKVKSLSRPVQGYSFLMNAPQTKNNTEKIKKLLGNK